MKIAVIGPKGLPSRISGLEVYVDNICSGLSKDYEITVFCRKRYCDKQVRKYHGIRVVHIPSINTKHLDAISYSLFAAVTAVFMGCDVFWYQALGPAVTACIPKLFGKKIIATVHGLDWKREKFGRLACTVLKTGERAIAKYAKEIIVLNKGDAAYLKNCWNRKTNIIANGVSAAGYKKAKIISETYGVGKDGYFLFLSRLVPEKNVHCLIKAFQMLHTDKKLVIAGKGVHTSAYEKEIKKMAGSNRNILFTGYVDGEILEELYSNAYAYILPSTIEGQSIGLLEAMSYGLPCIVSDIPENMEVIQDAGLSFASGNANDLRKVLDFALKNSEKMEAIGRKAKEIALSKHNWEESVSRTKEVINRCKVPPI